MSVRATHGNTHRNIGANLARDAHRRDILDQRWRLPGAAAGQARQARSMVNNADYDLVCIGSGPAGQRAAIQAAKLGKRVAVIEKQGRRDSGSPALVCAGSSSSGARSDRGQSGNRLELLARPGGVRIHHVLTQQIAIGPVVDLCR
jgi:hypothetical protein